VAGAILCTEEVAALVPDDVAILVSSSPQRDFAMIGRLIFPSAARPAGMSGLTGIAPTAVIDASARLEEGVTVEAGAFIGPGAEIGSGSLIGVNAVIGPEVRIGRDCHVGPRACIQHCLIGDRVIVHPGASLGQDGFGYVPGPRGAEKMPQLGRVVLQNDVEIGANTAIDRGALGDTIIGEGTKIDNLVQIGHNALIGRGCMIAGGCGLAGSVTLGDFVMLGGQVGIADHVRIGSFAQLAGGAGVMHDIPERGIWGGRPAKPIKEAMREQVVIRELTRAGRSKATNK
jgi:UDP-3-O-[3-hydroxymyristoyl] glucosamine N-acyltransferase